VHVRSPTGSKNFDRYGDDSIHEITKQDIVRSSLFVHRHNLHEALETVNLDALTEAFNQEIYNEKLKENLGSVPGAFSIPICRNPQGEAISRTGTKDGKNYPCMCGEFGWNNNQWSEARDQTPNFLVYSGFMFSEDWEDCKY
jgi:hypothetical protein